MGIREAFQFRPNDEEMLRCLLNRVTGSRSLAWCCDEDLIGTVDLYGSHEPWEVFGRDRKEKERFFFTELKRVGKSKTNQRICRNVGKGFWSNKGQKTLIYGQNGRIGYKRSFKYESKKGQTNSSSSDCDWLLKEYLLPEYVMRGVKEKYVNCALCVVKRRKKKKKGSGREEEHFDAAADFKINREWLSQQLGDDVLVDDDDDDDDATPCDRAAENDDHRVDNLTVVEQECSIPVVVVPKEIDELLYQQTRAEDVDGREQLPPVTELDECSIAPPFDFSSSSFEEGQNTDFDFGDYRAAPSDDHFAVWDYDADDLFGDYRFPAWADMLPVSVV